MDLDNKKELIERVRDYVPRCLHGFYGTGWEFLVKQVPLYLDDKLSPVDKADLDEHHSCSFANQYYVAFSEERFVNYYVAWCKDKEKDRVDTYDMLRTVKNILTHEFGHILLGHPYATQLKGERNLNAQILTMEIETNRGVHDRSEWFLDNAVHDDRTEYSPVKPMLTHEGIFNTIKNLLDNNNQPPEKKPEQEPNNNGQNSGQGLSQPPAADQNGSKCNSGDDSGQDKRQRADVIGMAKDTMFKDGSISGQEDLLASLGLGHSESFEKAQSIDDKVEVLTELMKNDSIKKALSKIKGELKGDISRSRVSTYSRPSRKTSDDGIMKRGNKYGKNKAPRVLIALDESGSMDFCAVKTAATAIKLLSDTIGRNKCDLHICKFANDCTMPVPIRAWKQVVDSYCPHGGTNFDNVCRRAVQENFDVVLCIGDGEGTISMPLEATGKLKWLDVLITGNLQTVEAVKTCDYGSIDKNANRRETLWLGNKSDRISKVLADE